MDDLWRLTGALRTPSGERSIDGTPEYLPEEVVRVKRINMSEVDLAIAQRINSKNVFIIYDATVDIDVNSQIVVDGTTFDVLMAHKCLDIHDTLIGWRVFV